MPHCHRPLWVCACWFGSEVKRETEDLGEGRIQSNTEVLTNASEGFGDLLTRSRYLFTASTTSLMLWTDVGVLLGNVSPRPTIRRSALLPPRLAHHLGTTRSGLLHSEQEFHLLSLPVSSPYPEFPSSTRQTWFIYIGDDGIRTGRPRTPLEETGRDGKIRSWVKKCLKNGVGRWLYPKTYRDSEIASDLVARTTSRRVGQGYYGGW